MAREELTRQQWLDGFKEGKVLTIWRRTDPDLQVMLKLEEEGLVEQKFSQLDEQSSCVEFKATKKLLES